MIQGTDVFGVVAFIYSKSQVSLCLDEREEPERLDAVLY